MFAGIGRQREAASEKRPAARGKQGRESLGAAALRGHGTQESEYEEPAFPRARPEDDRGGIGAVTIFLVVLAVLLVGAGGAGYWAVSQGYLDLGSMFRSNASVVAEAPDEPSPLPATEQAGLATGSGNTASTVT